MMQQDPKAKVQNNFNSFASNYNPYSSSSSSKRMSVFEADEDYHQQPNERELLQPKLYNTFNNKGTNNHRDNKGKHPA
ncbi:hypothetical protein DERF_003719 [Dermatophagoides farinae]|uniref:Uncharacterized protein n=1 Tax=Dermatophagoides farinae TaxID=6954 RepID=A0A922IE66_DERFA|nr:hypothetical protein DERF_003719 [Dermatophagoides farinae]